MNAPVFLIAVSLIVTASASASAQVKRSITFDDFVAVRAVSDPQLSPDGRWVLYAVRTADVDANRRTTKTFLQSFSSGTPRQFPNDSLNVAEARWSPDGRRIAYTTGGQLWVADVNGSNRKQLTTLTGGASGPVWAPTGDRIAFVSSVYPACRDDACNARREKEREANKVKAHVATELLYRHWTAWDEGTRSHLFVIAPDGSGMRDVTEAAPYDVPPGPFGGSEGYSFSTNGQEIAYTAKDAGREDAWSTDVNLYLVPVTGGPASVITAENKGADQNPVYSPDGRFIAYASQAEAGFESDRWRLMLYDRSTRLSRELLEGWDRNADAYFFAPDMKAVFVLAGEAARDKLFRFPLTRDAMAGKAQRVIADSNNVAFSMSRDGRTIVWARDATERPAELFGATLGASDATQLKQLTHLNDSLVSRLRLHAAEDFWYKGAGDDSVHGFVVRPPQWVAGKKFPVVLLIHGGPQGAWLDSWHSRWNYQLMAAPGFGIVVLNPRGSTGYGQKFVNGVSQDWGGKVYDDLMRGLDAALRRFDWLDSTRMGAAGGSFGGYMVNWIAGHSDRFDALVSHAGVFNLEHMYGATEELWFVEKEFNGPYWQSAAMSDQYRKYSPHLFAGNFKTPTLVLHGELDYRVPYTEGLSLFTALRRQNVPSRLVMYPDEGHWITKPQNQRLWWNELHGWLTTYLGKPAM